MDGLTDQKSLTLFVRATGGTFTLYRVHFWTTIFAWVLQQGHPPITLPFSLLSLIFLAVVELAGGVILLTGKETLIGPAAGLLLSAFVVENTFIPHHVYAADKIFGFVFLALLLAALGGKGLRSSLIWALRAELLFLYFSSGLHKLTYGDWLVAPVLQDSLSGLTQASPIRIPGTESAAPFWMAIQCVWALFEITAPVGFLCSRSRLAYCFIGSLGHIAIAILMKNFYVLSFQTLSFYLLFLPLYPPRQVSSQLPLYPGSRQQDLR